MGSLGEHKSYLQQNNFENLDEFDEQVLNDNMIEAQNRQEEFSGGWDFPRYQRFYKYFRTKVG